MTCIKYQTTNRILIRMYVVILAKSTGRSEHWICVYTDGTGLICVMDSLSLFMSLNKHTALQLAQIYSIPSTHSVLKVKRLCVQQQHGTLDCGAFSIAFAVEICSGRNPEAAHFDQKLMRHHLFECFTKERLSPFPSSRSEETLPRPMQNTYSLKVYCICKMPAQFDAVMLSCDLCGQWFHCSCMHIDSKNVPEYWECPNCAVEHGDT